MARRSLRDRNRAAIGLDTDGPPSSVDQLLVGEWSAEVTAEPAPPAADPAEARTTPSPPAEQHPLPQPAATIGAGATARLGIYLTPTEFDQAKAGYLADWTNGGTADTFARWIAAAIDTHAARTPRQRAAKATPKGRADERTGSTRSFSIPADTVARMRAAITADQHAGRWPSDSAWCGEAISLAVSAARNRNGGALPTPPPRLPNRLVR